MALVSIITPLYNSEIFIEETIESVLKQTYKEWEMIIVNDCSKDKGMEIVKKYSEKDKRIKLFNNKINLGGAGTRNVAIKNSQGKYIAFLDSDDIWKENKLEKQIKFMEKNNYYFSYTKYERINEAGEKMNLVSIIPDKLNYKDMLKRDSIGCLTAIYNQESLGKIYMPNIRINQDYALWLEILKKTKYAYGLQENLALYRVRENSLSQKKLKQLKYFWEMYRKYNKQSILKSSWYLLNNIVDSIFDKKMEIMN